MHPTTYVADRTLTADLKCGAMRYEVTPNDSADAIMALMIDHAYAAARVESKVLGGTKGQWHALFKTVKLIPTVGNVAEVVADLAQSLVRDPAKNTRDQFMDRLHFISGKMNDKGRAVFIVDPEKYLHDDSPDDWRLVIRNLPDKIKFVFAQRPDDKLIVNGKFMALPNAVRIPDDHLEVLDEAAVNELIGPHKPDIASPIGEVRAAIARYDGHPYAVSAALELLAQGTTLAELKADPTPVGVAKMQWKKVGGKHGADGIRLFEAYTILEVGVPDEVVEAISGLDAATRQALLAQPYLAGLLRKEQEGRRIYHSLLSGHIANSIRKDEGEKYHRRAIDTYRSRLHADTKPDALAAERLPEHVFLLVQKTRLALVLVE